MLKKPFSILLSLILLISMLFVAIPEAKALDIFPFVVIATGNLNGQINPFAYGENKDEGGLLKIATVVDNIRMETGAREGYSMLVDSGNSLTGSDISNLFLKKPLAGKPHPMITLMNQMKYDAAGYGTVDFSLTGAIRDARKRESNFSWVSTNAYVGSNYYTADHKMLVYDVPESAHVLKIGIISVPDPTKFNSIPSENIKGITFYDPGEEINRASQILRDIDRADFIILLTDIEWEKDPAKRKSSDLYKYLQRSSVDVCVCASDESIPGEQIFFEATDEFNAHDATVTSPGKYGLGVSRVELMLEKCKCPVKPYEVLKRVDGSRNISSKVVKVGRAVEVSKEASEIMKPYYDSADIQFSEVAGFANETFSIAGASLKPTSLSNLSLKTIKDISKSQIAFIKPSEILHNLNKGPLTHGDIYSLIASDDNIYSISLTGAQIKNILEENADNLKNGFYKSSLNTSGLNYIVDLSAPIGSRIKNLKFLNKLIELKSNFTAGITASLISGSGRSRNLAGVKILTNTRKTLRDQIIEYLRVNKNGIAPVTAGEWFLAPDYLDHWGFESISFLQEKKIISGYPDGRFLPDKSISRAEYTKIAVSAYEIKELKPAKPSYSDIKTTDWFFGFIEAAKNKGMLPFANEDSFYPNKPITREESMIELVVALQNNSNPPEFSSEDLANFKAKFKDGNSISDLSLPFMAFAHNEGLIKGYPDGTIRPNGLITRAETATIIFRAHFPTVFIAATGNIESTIQSSFKDPVEDRPIGGLTNVSSYIKQFETKYSNFISIDAGNYSTGSSTAFLSKAKVIEDIYSNIGINILGVSDKDLFNGLDPLLNISKNNKFSIISSDLINKDKKDPIFKNYTIKDFAGIKAGITQITGFSNNKPYLHKEVSESIAYLDSIKSANDNLNIINKNGSSISILIVSIQSSIDNKGELSENLKNIIDNLTVKPSLVITLNSIYGFTTEYKGINILAPGSYGNSIATSKFIINSVTKKIEKATINNEFTYTDAITPDKEILSIYNEHTKSFDSELSQIIGRSENGLTISSGAESTLGNLITDIMRENFKEADFAFLTPSIAKENISAGDIRVSNAYQVLPKDDDVVLLEMKGEDVILVLEYGATFLGGMVQVSGLSFEYDNQRWNFDRVVKHSDSNGEPIESDKIYKVAITESMRKGLEGYTMFGSSNIIEYSDTTLRNLLFKYIENLTNEGKSVDRSLEGRIKLVYVG